MDKKEFRKCALSVRDGIKGREEKSKKICERLLLLPQYKESKTLMCYVSFRSEAETRGIIKAALIAGKSVCVPVVENGQMYACYISDLDELTPGAYGILEPKEKRKAVPEDIDLCLVPGAAFDRCGGRIGYGGGYYDRFLQATTAARIALCFDGQVYDVIPSEAHDMKMDLLVTEKEVIYA